MTPAAEEAFDQLLDRPHGVVNLAVPPLPPLYPTLHFCVKGRSRHVVVHYPVKFHAVHFLATSRMRLYSSLDHLA